jgi:restriction endonuclease S subunit
MSYTEEISELVRIRLGNTFRGKIEGNEGGEVAVMQPRNLEGGKLKEGVTFISSSKISSLERHLLSPGDVLLSNKGTKFASFIYDGFPSKAIASSSFFVLVANEKLILPLYLLWYLNQESTLNDLASLNTGSAIPSLSKKALGGLRMPVPELPVQRKIAEMVHLVEKENQELLKLMTARKEYRDSYAWELITDTP